ncbi:MAG: S24/S26 family peptidase [Bacilli bacterium]|nr:S24/S26 family peptidase [Bacilli bacterium]
MTDYEQAIEKYGFFIATPIGTSMLPLLRERLDTVKLVAPTNIKKHDVVLYMRNDKTLVLHRIIRVHKDTFTMCGDNQCILEKHIKRSQIIAVMEGFYREEEYFPCTDKNYQKYVRKIIFKRPFKYLKHLIKKILKRK